jgi:hypothetical protein
MDIEQQITLIIKSTRPYASGMAELNYAGGRQADNGNRIQVWRGGFAAWRETTGIAHRA